MYARWCERRCPGRVWESAREFCHMTCIETVAARCRWRHIRPWAVRRQAAAFLTSVPGHGFCDRYGDRVRNECFAVTNAPEKWGKEAQGTPRGIPRSA